MIITGKLGCTCAGQPDAAFILASFSCWIAEGCCHAVNHEWLGAR